MLGKNAFENAYNYLKKARYESEISTSEENIMQGLRQYVKNPSDCFLVDQLLFLEEQAKLPTWHEQQDSRRGSHVLIWYVYKRGSLLKAFMSIWSLDAKNVLWKVPEFVCLFGKVLQVFTRPEG